MTKARPGPKKVSKARRHPDQPKPFSGIREVVFNAFAKIGSPVDKTDILNISRGAAGVRVEVIKTISFLTHRQMLKLIGSIRFKSVRLTRFRIGATQHKGKSALKFLFYVQGAKAAVTAGLDVDVLETDIQAALEFMADRNVVPQHPTRLSSFFDLVAEFNANNGFQVVGAMTPQTKDVTEKMRIALKREGIAFKLWGGRGSNNEFQVVPDTHNGSFSDHAQFFIAKTAKDLGCTFVRGMPINVREAVGGKGFNFYVGLKPGQNKPSTINVDQNRKFHEDRWAAYKRGGGTVEAASVDVKALERKYRLSSFTFRFSNRDGSLEVTRSVKAFTREHGLEILKAGRQIPKGFRVSSASGKAVPKTEATASAPEFLLYGLPKGETERHTETILYSKGKSEDDPMIEKVKGLASKDGWHSFRVAKFVPGTRPDFGRAVK